MPAPTTHTSVVMSLVSDGRVGDTIEVYQMGFVESDIVVMAEVDTQGALARHRTPSARTEPLAPDVACFHLAAHERSRCPRHLLHRSHRRCADLRGRDGAASPS